MANQKIMPTAKERKKNYTQNINKNNKKIIKESFFVLYTFIHTYTSIHINYTPMQSQSVKCFVVVPKDNKTRKQLQQWKIRKFGSFFSGFSDDESFLFYFVKNSLNWVLLLLSL